MESNFTTVLTQDPRLLVVDKVSYAVEKGAANITQSIFNANSASMSQIMFNVAVPSENVIIDRNMLISSTVSVIITVNNVTANEAILNIGNTDGFQAFPLSSLFSTLSATINNTTVSCNVAEILAPLLLMNEKEELYKYHGTTPCLPDAYYLSYDPLNSNYDATTSAITNNWTTSTISNNVLGTYNNNSLNTDFISRGSFPFTITSVVLTGGATFTGQDAFTQVRRATNAGNYQVYLSATFTEPLLLSPFLFGSPAGSPQGFYGIQNFVITANINGSCNKFWSTANPDLSIRLNPTNTFVNTKLIMQFLTPQPSQLLKSRNVVPYYSLPRFLSVGNSIPAMNPSLWNPTNSNAGAPFPGLIPSPQTITSSTLALNMIPDKLIICVRPQFAQQGPITSNSFLTITGISLSFNNSAGLLSSYSAYDLWRISVKNGSTQTWDSFCGFAMASSASGFYPVSTTGSLLILSFGEDIQLNDWLAPGSLGNYSLAFNLTVVNQSITYVSAASVQIPANTTIGFNGNIPPVGGNVPAGAGIVTPEILTITMQSGVFVCDRGVSSLYEGLLNKSDVLDASQQAPYTRNDVQRLIGGSIHDRLKSSIGYLMHKKGHHHSNKASSSVSGGSLGASVSGGGMTHSKIHRHVKH